MGAYETILVATDLSDPSLSAVREASALAGRLGSRIVLTYVIEDRLPPLILEEVGESVDALLDRHREQAEQSIERTVEQELPGREVEVAIVRGTAHDEIVRLAAEREVHLIVMGMHGHGFLTHALAGSTAERVLHRAPCPVLVVPHDS